MSDAQMTYQGGLVPISPHGGNMNPEEAIDELRSYINHEFLTDGGVRRWSPDVLNEALNSLIENSLIAENKQLREALERIAAGRPGEKYAYAWMMDEARAALSTPNPTEGEDYIDPGPDPQPVNFEWLKGVTGYETRTETIPTPNPTEGTDG